MEGNKPQPAWRRIVRIEAAGLRTAAAVIAPFLIGQQTGHLAEGLLIGLGALYVTIADKEGASGWTLLATTAGVGIAGLLGTIAGASLWLAVATMFLTAFCAGMAQTWGDPAFYSGFAVTIALAVMLGMSGDIPMGVQRLMAFGAGGLWATLLTLALWRWLRRKDADADPVTHLPTSEPEVPTASAWTRLRAELTFASPVFQHAFRLALVAAFTVALYKGLHLQRGYWLTITALVIVKPDYVDTRQRARERLVGSVIGGMAAVIFAALVHSIIALDVLLVLFCILAYSHSAHDYQKYAMFLTLFVVLLIDVASPGNWRVALLRITTTLVGGALALPLAYVLRFRETPAERKARTAEDVSA